MKIVCVTSGDPCGIGPEVALKGALFCAQKSDIPVLLVGSSPLLKQQAEELEIFWDDSWVIQDMGDISPRNFQIFSADNCSFSDFSRAQDSCQGGQASELYLKVALTLLDQKKVHCLATAPISKQSWNLAGISSVGHTEFLSNFYKVPFSMMTFFSDQIKMGLLTRHIPLCEVPASIKKKDIVQALRFIDQKFKEHLNNNSPRIAVAGLNPHAGESGALGTEEIKIIRPAIQESQDQGILVEGPFPSDTLFIPKNLERYDFFLMMYHDQGLIPFKTLAFETGVNVTLGLPFIRSSVDHGTAYDIVGKKMAKEANMISAIKWAVRLQQ